MESEDLEIQNPQTRIRVEGLLFADIGSTKVADLLQPELVPANLTVDHYDDIRLNSAIGYITPKGMLAGHPQAIQAE